MASYKLSIHSKLTYCSYVLQRTVDDYIYTQEAILPCDKYAKGCEAVASEPLFGT